MLAKILHDVVKLGITMHEYGQPELLLLLYRQLDLLAHRFRIQEITRFNFSVGAPTTQDNRCPEKCTRGSGRGELVVKTVE